MSSFSKIGPQILSQEMMKLVFPYEKEVLDNIEQIRDVAQKDGCAFREMLHVDEKKALMVAKGYSNAISILGSRGSGKTSIIMTLRDKLQKKNGDEKSPQRNIIMPFLAPQDFAEEEPLLGWVVSHLLKLGEKTVKEIKDGNQKDTYPSRRTGYRQHSYEDSVGEDISEYMTQLLEAFRLRSENAIGGHSLQFPERDQVYYYIDSVKQDAELQCFMLKLISEIVSYHRDRLQRNGEKTNSDGGNTASATEPLIILPIDDLDLTPNRSSEVLELVLRYLQHPNVVILCGWNYELFLNHLSIELLKQQGVLSEDMLNTNFTFNDVFMTRYRKQTTALITARRLALDSLKKAFPPAQRYEIRGLTLSQRADFMFNEEEGKEGGALFNTIVSAIQSCVHNSDSNAKDAKKKATQFLFDGNNDRLIVYMRIFDNKARGLINVHHAFALLKEGQDALNPKPDGEWDITDAIRALFDTILFSNSRFAPYRRGIRDLVQIKRVYAARKPGERTEDGERRLEYYCDYEAVYRMYEEYTSDKERIRADVAYPFEADRIIEQEYDYFPSVLIDIFLLLNFMENLLHSVTQTGTSVHGGGEFSKLLNTVYSPIRFSEQPQDALIRAIELSGVEELQLFPNTNVFATNISILNKYEEYDFEAQRYHFTGFRSLEKTFDLVRALLTDGNCQDEGTGLNKEKTRAILTENPEWLETIMMLFRDLYPSRENFMRYGAYVSLLNSLNNDCNDARTRADKVLQSAKPTKQANFSFGKLSKELLTDEDLDEIVRWLRIFDRNKIRFSELLSATAVRQKSVQGHNAENELIPRRWLSKAVLLFDRAVTFTQCSENFEKWINEKNAGFQAYGRTAFSEFAERMDAAIRYTDDPERMIYLNMEEVQKSADIQRQIQAAVLRAFSKTSFVIDYLLDTLRENMSAQIWKNHHRIKAKAGLQQYLLYASTAVWDYIERWELAMAGWGIHESEACLTLNTIFTRNFLDAQAREVRNLLTLGNNLKEKGRNIYSEKLNDLKRWVTAHVSYFDDEETDRLREAFRVLEEVTRKVRRVLPVEDKIYNVIMEIGEGIAEQYGIQCQKHFKFYGNSPSGSAGEAFTEEEATERMKYWPVSARYDARMAELKTTFAPLLPQKVRKQDSLFDADYDDFAFYYRKKNW